MQAEYLVSHLREQFAREAGELAVDVELVEGCIRLAGVVTSSARRVELERIAESMSAGLTVLNEIRVVPPVHPAQREPERLS
jgi:hypothetical protein